MNICANKGYICDPDFLLPVTVLRKINDNSGTSDAQQVIPKKKKNR